MGSSFSRQASSPVRILLIEDNEGDAVLVREALNDFSPSAYAVSHASTVEKAAQKYGTDPYDVLLLDLSLPGISGMEAVERVRQDKPELPIIVMTGMDDESKAIGALERGAQDYLVKGRYGNEALPRALRYAIERKRFENRVIELAHFDRLTGLINRDVFMDCLKAAIVAAKTSDAPLSVLLVDLSRFKDINDTHGHEMGNRLIKAVAVRLKECLIGQDALARLGGDEFVICIEGPRAAPESLERLARRILKQVSQDFTIDGQALSVGCSIGIASYPSCGGDETALLKHADIALHRAKKEGANHFQFFTQRLNDEVHERVDIEAELRAALKDGTLVPFYQPIVDLNTNRVCGVETLLRWQHPLKGMIPPARFIPVAESSELIVEISDHVLMQACRDYREWKNFVRQPFYVAVNLSAQDLKRRDFGDHLSRVLRETNVSFRQIGLEVTEGTLMQDTKQTVETLERCRELGSSILVDDFGTGYSSLSYLSVLPLDTLKIDRSFVMHITTNSHNRLIATSTINLAKGLGLNVVAEGIETREQRQLLMELGCDKGQGYYFAKPMPKAMLVEWLKAQS